ncbi:MAG: dipeptidase, partial [Verrucomicrobiota bacterium]
CAEWLVAKFQKMGMSVELHPTPGHPIVVAKNEHKEGRPTVLIYGHYDVQPVDPVELWDSPPFEPTVRDGVIFARGSTDNKGQNLAHILGVEASIAEDGDAPVNLIFLIEGEEEIGSPNLDPFLEAHRDLLKCDVVAVSDTGMVAPGVPTLTYGLRGIACLEFKLTGPNVDLHSGIYGGAVANPAMVAAQLAAGLSDATSGKVTVEGFYDAVQPLQDWEKKTWSRLPNGDQEMFEQTGVPALFGESGFDSYERRWARPTIEVNGIGGGYQGEGSKTVIPKESMVKLSCRLVPDQDPEQILELVEKHLRNHCPDTVNLEIEPGHSGHAYVMDPNTGYGLAAQTALKFTFDAEPMLIREGGSIPIIQSFKDVLGVDTLMLGLALPDCMAHAPNENFPIENFEAGVRMNRALLVELANS